MNLSLISAATFNIWLLPMWLETSSHRPPSNLLQKVHLSQTPVVV